MTNNALPARKSHRTFIDRTLIDRGLAALALAGFALVFAPTNVLAQDDTAPEEGAPAEAAPAETAPAETAPAAPAEAAPAEAAPAEAVATDEETTGSSGLGDPTDEPGGSPETIGTTTGDGEGEDEAATAEEEEATNAIDAQAETEPLAWRNSFFSWTQGLTFNSFVRDGQQTYNPYYYWSFSLLPRWYLDARLFLIASLGVSYELTDSDSTTYNHELQMSDTLVELRYTGVVDRFVFIPAVRITVPTSKFSQAAQNYFNTGIGLTTVLQIPEFLSSNIALGLSYRRWWAGSNTALAQNPYPASSASRFRTSGTFDATSGDIGSTSVMGGAANAVDRLLVALTFNVTPVSGLTLTLQGLMIFDRAEDNAEACVRTLTSECYVVPMDPNQSRWRPYTYFTLAAAYDVQPWLNLQLGIANSGFIAPLYNDDGSVRSPFNPDTQVYLSATVTLDGIYQTITEGGEDDGLTPEQRQRRRQGLASLDTDEDLDLDLDGSTHEDEEALSTRTLVGF